MFHITEISGNKKTGPIPVSMTEKPSCPPSCPFLGYGCYGETGHINIHWQRLTVLSLGEFCQKIKRLPAKILWRHNQAGDLPGSGENIDCEALQQITRANKNKRGFTYTHKHTTPDNIEAIRQANNDGFTINLSANNPRHADDLARHGLPVCTVVPFGTPKVSETPGKRKIVICPHESTSSKIQCNRCGLCQVKDRKYIIGFLPIGVRKLKVNAIAQEV